MLGAPFLLLTFLWAAKKSKSAPMDGRRNPSRGQRTKYTDVKGAVINKCFKAQPLTTLNIYYLALSNRKNFALPAWMQVPWRYQKAGAVLLPRFTCLKIDPLINQTGISVMLAAPFLLITFL